MTLVEAASLLRHPYAGAEGPLPLFIRPLSMRGTGQAFGWPGSNRPGDPLFRVYASNRPADLWVNEPSLFLSLDHMLESWEVVGPDELLSELV